MVRRRKADFRQPETRAKANTRPSSQSISPAEASAFDYSLPLDGGRVRVGVKPLMKAMRSSVR